MQSSLASSGRNEENHTNSNGMGLTPDTFYGKNQTEFHVNICPLLQTRIYMSAAFSFWGVTPPCWQYVDTPWQMTVIIQMFSCDN
jgi:hypothetical protein